MALLGSAGRGQKKEKMLNDTVEATSKSVKAVSGIEDQIDSSKICYKCKKPGHLARDCEENILQFDHALLATDEHDNVSEHSHAKFDGTTIEMDKIEIEEEGIHELGVEEKEKLNELDYLTGNPVPNDVLLYAVPVCGPYNALQTYKYRVKITPGTAKKGKAARSAMNLFHHMPEVTNREKELMKACTDAELIAAIIGNAKVTAPGLTQLKQKQKKGKKSAKNES
ncbi:hypothetical protein HPP92_010668 [Vanilla planifolia]|uniref:CCHC-type domain-containing protein n=1 Tax=Vanilla planifolia TaxID=51239 RepID=A0A835R1D0_VANPL|nr:hypothetical protein HPP92_010668 [Vanilla planifolia]